jgi:uncharacterized protein YbjT (DUF2867 family)
MRVLLFGATGSAGGSVLSACLASPAVTGVTAIVRRPPPQRDAKLRPIVLQDFTDYAPVEDAFDGIDACLFCLGTSVTQVPAEAAYRRITHDFAIAAAATLLRRSPAAPFHFVSGAGTGLHSRFMWARVKAETERDLIALAGAVCWRPAAIDGVPSAGEPRLYAALRPLYRLMTPFRGLYIHGEALGRAMLQATAENLRARIIENREIRDLDDRAGRFRGAP